MDGETYGQTDDGPTGRDPLHREPQGDNGPLYGARDGEQGNGWQVNGTHRREGAGLRWLGRCADNPGRCEAGAGEGREEGRAHADSCSPLGVGETGRQASHTPRLLSPASPAPRAARSLTAGTGTSADRDASLCRDQLTFLIADRSCAHSNVSSASSVLSGSSILCWYPASLCDLIQGCTYSI